MTSSESPAGLLRRAAERVRERGEAATAGPWKAQHNPDAVLTELDEVADCEWSVNGRGDASWIALVSPEIAGPLADWLDAAARSAERAHSRATSTTDTDRAVAVVRALLGEQP